MSIKPLILLMLGLWLGMVLGISFLEAPLKFRAPNITLSLGLGIGQLVFSALNKMEMGFSILLALYLFAQYKGLSHWTLAGFGILLLLVLLQSFWLLPLLNARVESLLQGVAVAKSNHHFYYVAMEVSKVALLIFGFFKIYHYDGFVE